MQTYDMIMLFVLVGLTLYGYAKGLAWQVAYLASFIVSYFVMMRFSDQFAPVFGDAAPWNKFAAMAAIYAGTSLAIWIVFRAVRKAIDKVRLEGFDRQMGAIMGAARGVLWCVGITFFAVTLLPEGVKQQVIGSRSGEYIARLLDKADGVVPDEVHQVIGPHLERLEQELNQGGQPGGFATGQPTAPGGQFGWPQTGQSQNGAGQGTGWPALPQPTLPQPTGQPATAQGPTNGWPNFNPQPAPGTPAQPAAWPSR